MRNTEGVLSKGGFRTDVFKFSFFNRIVDLWSSRPVTITTIPGIGNRTFGNRTQSNSIHGNSVRLGPISYTVTYLNNYPCLAKRLINFLWLS